MTPATRSEARVVTQERPRDAAVTMRRIGMVMAFIALTLAFASAMHLAGMVDGRSDTFNPTHAGIVEAIICIVLASASVVMVRTPARARPVAIGAIAFATIGFLVGLTFTARGGHIPDIAYHLVLLPVLIASLVIVMRMQSSFPQR